MVKTSSRQHILVILEQIGWPVSRQSAACGKSHGASYLKGVADIASAQATGAGLFKAQTP